MRTVYFSEALRMLRRRVRVAIFGLRRYAGGPEQISRQIINDCFRGHFNVSAGHFSEFYCRDIGWCAQSLLDLGYEKELAQTLEYALEIFARNGRVEQTISPSGAVFTFPDTYSPDALAFLVHSLRVLGDTRLVARYNSFLEREIAIFSAKVIDSKTGLVRADSHFSSMKDYSVRRCSCYDNCMVALLSKEASTLGLRHSLPKDMPGKIIKHFWNGKYFLDDLSGSQRMSADANIIPFWCGLINDDGLLKKAIASIKLAGLDRPFPLRYSSARDVTQRMIGLEVLAGDYERDTVWTMMGLMYISLLRRVKDQDATKHLGRYTLLVNQHKNFLEVFDRNGMPFKTVLYYSDESMLWVSMYLSLKV